MFPRHEAVPQYGRRYQSVKAPSNYTPARYRTSTANWTFADASRTQFVGDKLKRKDKTTITFPLIHRQIEKIVQVVTQSDSSMETFTHEESVTAAHSIIDRPNKSDV